MRSPFRMAWLAACLAVGLFAASCGDDPDKKPGNQGGEAAGGAGGEGEGGGGVGGEGVGGGGVGGDGAGGGGGEEEEICYKDSDCPVNTGTRCDTNSESETFGECIPAEPCITDSHCGSTTMGKEYCERGGCYCISDATAEAPATGICRRKAGLCGECEINLECGGRVEGFETECKAFQMDGVPTQVCLPKPATVGCPIGYVAPNLELFPNLAGFCVPAQGDCAVDPCVSDTDCTDLSAPICDRARQICVPACTFDYEKGESRGCSPAEVCHVSDKHLDGTLWTCDTASFYGRGKCGLPCETDDQCATYGEGFVCRTEPGAGEKRCRPDVCLDDRECALGEEPYLGYCDIRPDHKDNSCVIDTCRTGDDPRKGCGADEAYGDCSPTHKCVAPDEGTSGPNTCELKDCLDLGGAATGCYVGNYCSGESRRDGYTNEIVEGVQPIGGGAPPGECFGMDVGAFCDDTDCTAEACDETKNPWNYEESPTVCTTHPDGNPHCSWGCLYPQDCPSGWSCVSNGMELSCDTEENGFGLKTCVDDIDCGVGNRCVYPTVGGEEILFNGRPPFKVCECSNTPDGCGPGFQCNAGIATVGQNADRLDTYGVRQARYCARTDVCGPNGSCEFWGDYYVDEEGTPVSPRALCSTTPKDFPFPGGDQPAEKWECPESFGGLQFRAGRLRQDAFLCVHSSFCTPGYYTNDDGEEVCGIAPPKPPL